MVVTAAELDRLDAQRQALLLHVDGWSTARLAFRPDSQSWSAVEVFDHIVMVETEILVVAQVGLANPHPLGIRDHLGNRFLQTIFRSDRRVKVPKSVPQVLPGAAPEMQAVLARWIKVGHDLTLLAEAAPSESADRGIFRHPVGGWMTLSGVIRFFAVHRLHHGYQLDRLRSASQGL